MTSKDELFEIGQRDNWHVCAYPANDQVDAMEVDSDGSQDNGNASHSNYGLSRPLKKAKMSKSVDRATPQKMSKKVKHKRKLDNTNVSENDDAVRTPQKPPLKSKGKRKARADNMDVDDDHQDEVIDNEDHRKASKRKAQPQAQVQKQTQAH